MIRRLINSLFGRGVGEHECGDTIYWENGVDQGIARVHVAPDGTVYYWRYPLTKVLDRITDPKRVIWLTCHPSKYFPQEPTP